MKPVSEWDEVFILSLPQEDNRLERKGAMKLDLSAGANQDDVLAELAKQLSAFSNMGGGRIIYGLKDDGTVDNGGVSTQVKNGTKEWLERRIPELTEFEITGFGVYEFGPKAADSQIRTGKAIYVVDVPDSDRAPHQSTKDQRYYVRLGSQSLPAPHKLIEDIRNRQRHPRVTLGQVSLELRSREPTEDRELYALVVTLTVSLVNEGALKSVDTFLSLNPDFGHMDFLLDKEVASGVTGVKPPLYMWQVQRPIPPRSQVSFRIGFHLTVRYVFHPPSSLNQWYEDGGTRLEDVAIEWTIFADSAAPREGRVTMNDIGLIEQLRSKPAQR
jgi:hypothetical protein